MVANIPRYFLVVIISFNFVRSTEVDRNFMPMVAFLCRRPAMHLTEDGWKKDEQIDCLIDPKDILQYCKHVYPKLDVRYVVEASDIVRISNWCKSGRDKCSRHTHAVRPFRCLVKPFISDALLVPKNCIFDHIHETSQCKGYSDWDVTAGLACTERGMFLKSFAMIQPCDVNKFTGTEFVCCPVNYNDEAKKGASQIMVVDKKHTEVKSEEPRENILNNKTKIVELNPLDDKTEGHKKHVKKIVKQTSKVNEVSIVAKMKAALVTTPHARTASIEKADEIDSKLKMLDDQKKLALENYLKSLNDEPISVARVLSTLKKFVKIQQKGRFNAVESFKNFKDSQDGEKALEKIEKHLKEIDQSNEEALQMLEKIPKHGEKMRQHMDDYIRNLPSINESILHPSTTSQQPTQYSSTGYNITNDVSEVNTVKISPSMKNHQADFEPIPAHLVRNQLNVEQPHLKKIAGKTNMAYVRHGEDKMTNPVGIILTSIGLVLIVVIGIVALIKRVNSVPVTNGYLDKPCKRNEGMRKSSSSGSSIRRQNSMNGYENPTYRYFEAHVNPN